MTSLYLAAAVPTGFIFGLGVRNAATLPQPDLDAALTGGVIVAFLVASYVVAYIDSWGRT